MDRNDDESECLSLGQIALTHQTKGEDIEALEFYEKCREKSKGLDNLKLELDCLSQSLKIREQISIRTGDKEGAPTEEEYVEALEAAKAINDNKVADMCKVSMAVVQGQSEYEAFVQLAKDSFNKESY